MSSQITLPVSFKDRPPTEADLPFFAYANCTPYREKPPAVVGWLPFPLGHTVCSPSVWSPSYTHFLPNTTTKPTQTPDQLIAEFVGEGYRLLGKTELIEEGDEWHSFGDVWTTTQRVGSLPYSATYRRQVAAPAPATKPNLWRQLDPSEKVLEGDVLVDEDRLDHVTVDLTADEIPNSRPSVNWMPQHEGEQASHGVYFRRLPLTVVAGCITPDKLIAGVISSIDTPAAIDPGEGYVLLAEGTKLEIGDEYYDDKENVLGSTNYAGINTVGGKGCEYTYRRKIKAATPAIDPGAGYRLLVKGEKILSSDQFRSTITPNTWADTVFAGKTVGEGPATGFTYRRKVEIPAPAPVAPEPQIAIQAGYRTLKVGELFASTDKVFTKHTGRLDDLAVGIVGHVVKENDLRDTCPYLWLRPIVTAKAVPCTEAPKPQPVFKVGDRVRLLGGWNDESCNPIWGGIHGKVVGTVTSYYESPHHTNLSVGVRWDNGQSNPYHPDNLGLHVEEPVPHHQTGKLPPAGYRWLKQGEKREDGDRYEALERIVPATIGWEISSCDCILRPLTAPAGVPAEVVPFPAKICPGIPPAGYRFLAEGEVVRVGDRAARRDNGKTHLHPVIPGDTFDLNEEIGSGSMWCSHVVGQHESDFTVAPFVRKLEILAPAPDDYFGGTGASLFSGWLASGRGYLSVIDLRDKKIAELEKHVANLQRKGQRQREALNKQQDSIQRLNEQRAQESMERSAKVESNARDVRELFDDRPDRIESLHDLSHTPGSYQLFGHEDAKKLVSYVDALESTLTRIAL